jgi:SAM-dependent methyltransferase
MPITDDPILAYKAAQRAGWVSFAPLEMLTTPTAAQLVSFARIRAGQDVLDVACGTGVVSVTAARRGARVTGIDLTPELLEHARENSQTASVSVDWHEGDVEQLPFGDAAFDVVVSQFGHMFAPRPAVALAEMLRVLKPGGTIAFSTWPPELCLGRIFILAGRFMPPPPPGVSPPNEWGEPDVVRERLGSAVKSLTFQRRTMRAASLSPQHHREHSERTSGQLRRVMEGLKDDPARLALFRQEYEAIIAEYFEDNIVHQGYLMTRATKA